MNIYIYKRDVFTLSELNSAKFNKKYCKNVAKETYNQKESFF